MGGWRTAIIVFCGRSLSRLMLFMLRFYWINETYRIVDSDEESKPEEKEEGEEAERPGAIILNHMSYLDILHHMSSSFSSFVVKRSVAKLLLVGLMCEICTSISL